MQKIKGTAGQYPFLKNIIAQWKPRAKKIKIKLKDVALEAKITPQYLTKIITGLNENPRLETIDNVEKVLKTLEEKAGV